MFTVQLPPQAVNTSLSESALCYTSVSHTDAQIMQSKKTKAASIDFTKKEKATKQKQHLHVCGWGRLNSYFISDVQKYWGSFSEQQ